MIYPDLPFLHAGGDGGLRPVTQMVVIHATDNTAPAISEARYAVNRADQTSAHFYSDEGQVIQALDTSHVAYGCYPIGNARSIQFELVGLSNEITDATLRRVAPIVARVCADWDIPVVKVGPADLVAGTWGICGHIDVTNAWGQGDHTDPGTAFPWSTFLGYVQAALNPASEEDDMGASLGPYRIEDEGTTSLTIPPVHAGLADPRDAWLNICNDTFGHDYQLRVWWSAGNGSFAPLVDDGDSPQGVITLKSGQRFSHALPTGCSCLTVSRVGTPAYAGSLSLCIERGPVIQL